MTFKVNVKADFKQVSRMLTKARRKQIPFATSLALNMTANDVKVRLQKEMRVVFKNPSKFTINSLKAVMSNKRNLQAYVWVKDMKGSRDHYILPHIFGGTRPLKPFERHFKSSSFQGGEFRVINNYMMPSPRIKTGKGRVTRGLHNKVLAGAGRHPDKHSRSKKGSSNAKYFVGKIKGTEGVWERTKKGAKPVFIFVDKVHYRKRFDFFGIAEKVAAKKWEKNFDLAWKRAIATAR